METILDRLSHHAEQQGDVMAMAEQIDGQWRERSWRQVRSEVEQAGRALIALGVESGGCIGILGVNRPCWTLACLAALGVGATPAGIYQTCAPNQVAYILRHGKSRLVFVDSVEQWRKVEAEWEGLPDLELAVFMNPLPEELTSGDFDLEAESRLITWDDFLARGDAIPVAEVEARRGAIESETPATLIYTSGTTGDPKAVMLSHGNIMETGRIGAELHQLVPSDRIISYLPLAHIAEQMMSVHISVYVGYSVYYVPSPDLLAAPLQTVRPTLFFGVPRVWERMYDALQDGLSKASAVRRALAHWALGVGERVASAKLEGRPVPLGARLAAPLADKLVLSKVCHKLGFDALRIGASGAAPIRAEILQLFFAIGAPIYEVYGLSETCGPTTWNAKGRTKVGTVGPPIPDVQVRIADDGEVLVQGPNVFLGYLHNEAATREAIDPEGWFHTGDLGYLDDDGYLVINGRKKDLLITSGGKNIAPSAIEGALKQLDGVQEAIVLGDGRRFLTALLSLDPELTQDADLEKRLQEGVDAVNGRLARVESIRKFRILPRPLSLEEGELTPTLKVKRHVVQEHFQDLIDDMYG